MAKKRGALPSVEKLARTDADKGVVLDALVEIQDAALAEVKPAIEEVKKAAETAIKAAEPEKVEELKAALKEKVSEIEEAAKEGTKALVEAVAANEPQAVEKIKEAAQEDKVKKLEAKLDAPKKEKKPKKPKDEAPTEEELKDAAAEALHDAWLTTKNVIRLVSETAQSFTLEHQKEATRKLRELYVVFRGMADAERG